MKRILLDILACPACSGPLALEPYEEPAEIESGLLSCACGSWYPILNGIPRLLLGDLRDDYGEFVRRWNPKVGGRPVPAGGAEKSSTKASFSAKWVGLAPGFGFDRPDIRAFYDTWFRQKLAIPDDAAFARFFQGRRWMIDAGCGSGNKVETMCRLSPAGQAVGLDLSGSVEPARKNLSGFANAHVVQADLTKPPFRAGSFDFVSSDGVIHHTPDTRTAFEALVPILAPGAHILIHVYRRLNPIREFTDDHIRSSTTRMTPEECWEASQAFTDLGRTLAEMNVTVDVPRDLPLLGIEKGKVPLQRLFYNRLFQCFWNPTFTYDENNLVNFDWFHPPYAYRHTVEEVRGWMEAAGLVDVNVHVPNEKGVSGVGRKAGPR